MFNGRNPLFLWPFSIAMLVHQRVVHVIRICSGFLQSDIRDLQTSTGAACEQERHDQYQEGQGNPGRFYLGRSIKLDDYLNIHI